MTRSSDSLINGLISTLPLVLAVVTVVSYCNGLQAQIDVLKVRQEGTSSQVQQSLNSLKEDMQELKDALRLRK